MPGTLALIIVLDLFARCRREEQGEHGPSWRADPVRPDEVTSQRSLACSEYDRCLDIACRRGWPSWTCRRCPRFPLAAGAPQIERGHLVPRTA
jgi:hypothetical protein